MNQDAEVISRLCGERDELRQTRERLRLEHSTAHEEHNQAIQEHSKARWEAMVLQADLGDAVVRRLVAEEVSVGLATELAEVRGILRAKSDEHDLLRAAVVVVCNNQQVVQGEGIESLPIRTAGITA